jgi:D-xylose transport system permease protein
MGLLAILGLQLYVLGTSGSINLPYGSPMVNFGQMMVIPAGASYLLALVPGAVMLAIGLHTRARRTAARLSAATVNGLVTRCVVVTLLFEVIVAYLNRGRGVPLMFGVFLALAVAMDYALTRTRWGRSMNAVGGNREAARRAGINVNRVYTSAFVLCASLAALGGVLSAARLASASQQAGTGDVNLNAIAAAVIGGTSLFGGRGSAYSAVLGVIVIQSIASGLTLLNLSSSLRFMITGAVLAIAVIVDSLARQSRVTHGRA